MDTAEILSIGRRFETLERLLSDIRDRLLELEDRVSRLTGDLRHHNHHE